MKYKHYIPRFFFIMCGFLVLVSCNTTFQTVSYASGRNNSSGRITIYRSGVLDPLSKIKIYLNDTLIGKLGPKRHISWLSSPGEYILKAKDWKSSAYTVKVEAGKDYWFTVKKKIGVPYNVVIELAGPPDNPDLLYKKPKERISN